MDVDGVCTDYLHSRNSLMPLINGLRKACDKDFGEYVHYGVTTQDVLDTAEILELREGVKVIYRDLRALEEVCLDLVKRHRSTPMVARTHGQQALPMTFGLKGAVWLNEIRRHIDRTKLVYGEIAVGQLSGAVGTMAALGPKAMEVAGRTLKVLGLEHSKVAWHNSRDNIGEVATVFSLLVTTLEKVSNEIFQLQKTEIGELREGAPEKTVSSTTMPHKKNPVICQRIVALSRHARFLAGVIVESMAHEHERDARSLWAEWLAVPQLCIYTGTALKYMLDVMTGLEIQVDRMMENLYLQKSLITSEWLLFRLGSTMGKMKSLEKLHALSKKAADTGISLKQVIMDDPEVGSLLTPEELSYLDHPEKYIGHAVEIVDHAVEEIERKRAGDSPSL